MELSDLHVGKIWIPVLRSSAEISKCAIKAVAATSGRIHHSLGLERHLQLSSLAKAIEALNPVDPLLRRPL